MQNASGRRSSSESRPRGAASALPFQLPTSAITMPCGSPSARNSLTVRPALLVMLSPMRTSKPMRVNKSLFGIIRKQDQLPVLIVPSSGRHGQVDPLSRTSETARAAYRGAQEGRSDAGESLNGSGGRRTLLPNTGAVSGDWMSSSLSIARAVVRTREAGSSSCCDLTGLDLWYHRSGNGFIGARDLT